MNPLQFLYDTVDIIKDGKNGKVSLVYDKVGKLFYVMKERDLRVAEIYRRLKNIKSPYLPEIYHAVEYDGKFFIVEEFIQGRTLYEILNRNNGLGEKKTAEIFKQLCDALKILHAQKIIHRDIKPSNIMITKTGGIKLIDFSISRITKENHETDTDFLGTRGYAPPEQYGFGQTDSRSDIYSVGVTIQRILGKNYSGWLEKIISRCTKLDPEDRYQSVNELLDDFDRRYWRQKFNQMKNSPQVDETENDLDIYEKIDELVKLAEDLNAVSDESIDAEENSLRKRLLERSEQEILKDLEKIGDSFTPDDFKDLSPEEIAEIKAECEKFNDIK